MKKMLAIGLAATLGVTCLVWSAMGQQGVQEGRTFYGTGQSTIDPSQVGQPYSSNYQLLQGYGTYAGQNGAGDTLNLARQLAKAKTETEREKIRTKLGEQLEKQFDERQKKHKAESEALEAQVSKLKELIATRNENKKEIISRRLEQIVRDAQGLGW